SGEQPSICVQSTVSDCLCSPAMRCKPGCTSSADCAAGQICAADHHCAPSPCAADADGIDDFVCASGGCQRASCDGDGDCKGYCVKGSCYPPLGFCSPLPP